MDRPGLKKSYLALTMVMLGIFRGVKEGMVMEKPGVRDHRWFKNYHPLSLLVPLSAGLFFIALSRYIGILDLWTSTAMCILTWEAFEIAYSYARYNKFIPKSENVFGFGLIARDHRVIIIHVMRLLVGITLLFGGML